MDIFEQCEDPQNSTFGPLACPSNTMYPPATVCAVDFAKQACFSPGESGSPLMVEIEEMEESKKKMEERKQRFYVEGILSFVKGRGCDIYSNNPSAYTKLSCFLPWIAKQYGMHYDSEQETDPKCFVGTPGSISDDQTCLERDSRFDGGKNEMKEKCQNTPSNLQEFLVGEQDCIFPFYYNGRMYNECIVFTEAGFVYPAFRCPVLNIITKIDGINNFEIDIIQDADQTQDCPSFGCTIFQVPRYCLQDCLDPDSPLNPNKKVCDPECRRAAFSTCKNNCPGVGSLGIIGGGALLFAAAPFVGQALLAPAGLGAVGLGGFGLMMANTMCSAPFCTTPSGQCCMFQLSINGLVCPSRC
eukprot:GFUD01001726.1.p1 GENE.GFUD01001726.1~~GFUD01001726.1.p1  ORF type:complete len:404 (+),score=66.49 GFUD01001726.1:142-1212(+)